MATVFLTGASGFLGGHLLCELIYCGHSVKCLSHRAEVDLSKAERELGYALLAETLAWMKAEGMVGR